MSHEARCVDLYFVAEIKLRFYNWWKKTKANWGEESEETIKCRKQHAATSPPCLAAYWTGSSFPYCVCLT